MADLLTQLEDKLDARYKELSDRIGNPRFVKDWDDWNFRAGYLEAVRDLGNMIKEMRVPVTGEEGIANVMPAPEEEIVDGQ